MFARAAEKVLAVRQQWAADHPDLLARLLRAHRRAADHVANPDNHAEVAALLAPRERVGVAPAIIRQTLDGRLPIAAGGPVRISDRYLMIGRTDATRPDPVQAAWIYAQMVRWRQAPMRPELLAAAKATFRADLYDHALGAALPPPAAGTADGIGAFAGPAFDADDIPAHLAAWND
jgi:NitT/TauT family transport system ATP-binding protein